MSWLGQTRRVRKTPNLRSKPRFSPCTAKLVWSCSYLQCICQLTTIFLSQRCDKCLDVPAQELLRRISKRKSIQKKRKISDELMEDETAYALRLGGWMSCLKCCS